MTIETFRPFTRSDGKSAATRICDVDVYFLVREIPEDERFPFALQHLSDPVQNCVMSLTSHLEMISGSSWEWDWSKLKVALRGIENQIRQNGFISAIDYEITRAAKVGFVAGMAYIAVPFLVIGGLCTIGFSPIVLRPVTRSITAGIHAVAAAMIKLIQERPPSTTWKDGENFRPSMTVIEGLLRML